jgi:large subunit ribosomal protein L24
MKLKVGDMVEVMAGKDRGKKGKIERVFPRLGAVTVEKVNRMKKHLKTTRSSPRGGIVDIAHPIPISGVMLICPHCNQKTRVATKLVGAKKIRTCRKCQKAIEKE